MGRNRLGWSAIGAVLLTVLAAMPAIPGVGSPRPVPASSSPGWADQLLRAPLGGEEPVLAPSVPISVMLTLEPRDAASLVQFDRAVSDPASPRFAHYLSESGFERRFAPAPSNLTRLEQYFANYGGNGFHPTSDDLGLSFTIDARGVDEAFATRLATVPLPNGGIGRVLDSPPSLPGPIGAMIAGVNGITGERSPGGGRLLPSGTIGTSLPSEGARAAFLNGTGAAGGTQWFVGSDFVGLYNETPLLPGGPLSRPDAANASSQAVATLLMSGYNASTNVNLPPWDPTQVDAYFNDTFPASWPKPVTIGVPVTISGITPPLPGPNGGRTDDSNDQLENSLDLEMAGSTAPGAEVANFYFPASLQDATPSAATDQQIADDFATSLSSALSFNYSGRTLASVSASFGIADLNDSLWNLELEHAAAIGVTVVASSGDSGNAPASATSQYLGSEPGWPASAAFNGSGTIAVGGTSLVSAGSATGTYDGGPAYNLSYDAAAGPIGSESVWYNTAGAAGQVSGTEGGGTTVYPEPYWQFHSAAQPSIADAEGAQGLASLGRAEPDIGLAANETIAYTRTDSAGTVYYSLLQGTSVSAPLFAGMVAEWSAVAGHGFGYLDPAIYRMESYFSGTSRTTAPDPFLDVTRGSNYLFHAGPGWDAATGWGGIDASRFLTDYGNSTILDYQYTGPTPLLPAPATPISTIGIVLIAAVGALLTGVVLMVVVLSRRSPSRRLGLLPSGFPPPPPTMGGPIEGATFECPYCGGPRPAEPVRCPNCGRL